MARKVSRPLRLESFEPRRVLYFGGVWTPTIDPSASAAEHAAHYAQYNSRTELGLDGDVQSYNSRAAVDAKLSQLASSYWDGLLGRPVAEVQAVGRAQTYQIADGYGYQTTLSKFQAWAEGQVESGSLVKTTDGFIYIPADDGITIVDAHDSANLATKHVEASSSSDSVLYLEGDRLIRVSRPTETFPNSLYGVESQIYRPTTRVEVFDISNRVSPVLAGQLTFEGEHVASAMQNGRLTLVQFSDPNLELPQPIAVTRTDGTQVFESTEQYLARNRDAIYAAVIPSYQRTQAAGSQASSNEIGDWQDLKVAVDTLQQRTSIVTLDVTGQPQVIDSELILGMTEPMVYVGLDHVYLLKNSSNAIDIYRVTVDQDGEVETNGHVQLIDASTWPGWVSEDDGVLRVLTGPGMWNQGAINRSSVLVTIGDAQGQWQVEGQVQIASSLVPTSVYFDGPQAVVLTGENYYQGQPATNYIVTLDLSNAAAPRQLNSFQIPNFSTYLKQIDSDHWIGLRYGGPDSRGYLSGERVITLYGSSPDEGLEVLDSWTDKSVFFNTNVPYRDVQIEYDPESGLVMVDGGDKLSSDIRSSYSPVLLRVALGTSDPLQPVTIAGLPENAKRTFVQEGTLFVVTAGSVITYDTADLTRRSDLVYLPGSRTVDLAGMGHRLSSGQIATIPVLGGYGSDFFKVTSVELSGQLEPPKQSKVTILENGMLQIQAATVATTTSEFLTIHVRYFDGQEDTLYQGLYITNPSYQEPSTGGNNDTNSRTWYQTNTPVKIWTSLQDASGQPVDNLRSGDEAWVVVGAEDLSELRLGILGGYFQVNITSGNAEVIGQPEFLGKFQTEQVITASDHGFSVLGAKSHSWNSDGSARSDIVRFKIRASDDQPLSVRVTPTPVPDQGVFEQNILVYMGSEIHSTANAEASVLSTGLDGTVTASEGNSSQDINGDGAITALDVLQIINYINSTSAERESVVRLRAIDQQLSKLDVSGDGDITALDALLVINTLNSAQRLAANAEGEISTNSKNAADLFFDGSFSLDVNKKNGSSRVFVG